jgi:hypothetical protein
MALLASDAWAFDPPGHDIIEAAAYRRLLTSPEVPGTGISGRALLGALIAQGILLAPPCFEAAPGGPCRPEVLREMPLRSWPPVGSGSADLLIDRQLDQGGQCQHFMATTEDGLSPLDPRLGVPRSLATTAYDRCLGILGAVLEGILRHPRLSASRVVGMYVMMHAIEDSFSQAHARRDPEGRIVHLLSWKLLDWPRYLWHGRAHFPAETHHGITDPRDAAYLLPGARAADGRPCQALHQPYAVPEECLGPGARAAVDAITDLLVLTYRLRARAVAEARVSSLESPADRAEWEGFLRKHLPSTAAEIAVSDRHQAPRARPSYFVGALGGWRPGGWEAGPWAGRLFFEPALPFAIGFFGGAGYVRVADGGHLAGSLGLSLYLPVVRRFALGFSPAALQVVCTTDFGHCQTDGVAKVGNLIVPLGRTWLSLQGPTWSWSERRFRDARLALAVGWWFEHRPREAPADATAPLGWEPPLPAEVEAFRLRRTTSLVYLTTTVASTTPNRTVGVGLETFLDRDRWNRRAGIGAGLSLEFDYGFLEGSRARVVTIAPQLRAYVVPERLALVLAPAVARIGTMGGDPSGVDVAGRVGVVLAVGRIEVTVDAPPLSYLSQRRWHAQPFSVGLALLLY